MRLQLRNPRGPGVSGYLRGQEIGGQTRPEEVLWSLGSCWGAGSGLRYKQSLVWRRAEGRGTGAVTGGPGQAQRPRGAGPRGFWGTET